MSVEREAVEARRGKEELETVVETLRQQNRDLQIEKDTEVAITWFANLCYVRVPGGEPWKASEQPE